MRNIKICKIRTFVTILNNKKYHGLLSQLHNRFDIINERDNSALINLKDVLNISMLPTELRLGFAKYIVQHHWINEYKRHVIPLNPRDLRKVVYEVCVKFPVWISKKRHMCYNSSNSILL